jgi:SET domain-containing protein
MFTPSCEPNLRLDFDYDIFALEARTLRDVEEGEELMFAYTGASIEDVEERRLILKACWGFTCECNRCISQALQLASP